MSTSDRRSFTRKLAIGFLSLVIVVVIRLAMWEFQQGRELLGAVWLLTLALLCTMLVYWYRLPFTQPRAEVDSTGTTFSWDPHVNSAILAIFALLTLTFAAWGYLYLSGEVTLGLDELEPAWTVHYSMTVFTIGAFGLSAYCAAILGRILRQKSGGLILLTPTGLAFSDLSRPRRADWADITAITDTYPPMKIGWGRFSYEDDSGVHPCPVTVEIPRGKPPAISDLGTYWTDGDDLRELIRFYHQHPAHRAELTDDRALQRLQGRNFSTT